MSDDYWFDQRYEAELFRQRELNEKRVAETLKRAVDENGPSVSEGCSANELKQLYRVVLLREDSEAESGWLRLTQVEFRSDEPLQNVQGAVLDVANEFVTDEEDAEPT